MMSHVRRAARLALQVLLASAPLLWAHPSRRVKAEEMQLFADRIVLFVRYEVSEPRFATDLRERFDSDADRRLSGAERDALAEYVLRLATEDLRVSWDGETLEREPKLGATSGLDRDLPSAYPVVLYWQIDFLLPPGAGQNLHALELSDREARWESDFSCTVRFAPEVAGEGAPQTFGFRHGSGSFRIPVSIRSRPRNE
jgi:hypothetical protein